MAKYVNKDAVLPRMEELVGAVLDLLNVESLDSENEEAELKNTAIELWEAIPAADVRPERHGKCVTEYDGLPFCSECNCNNYGGLLESMTYCPNCGAKIGGELDDWISVSEQLPPENQIVDTKIDDEKGIRNEQQLVFCMNRWFFPDKSMYVYYSPTHWRFISNKDGDD